MTVKDELLALERRGWAALTSDGAAEYYERMLADDMVLVLPGMVLDRADALESWLNVVPWQDFEIEDPQLVSLGTGAAVLTYRATMSRPKDVTSYRAQCTSVYRRVAGRWRLAFQQQTPLSPVLSVDSAQLDGAALDTPGRLSG